MYFIFLLFALKIINEVFSKEEEDAKPIKEAYLNIEHKRTYSCLIEWKEILITHELFYSRYIGIKDSEMFLNRTIVDEHYQEVLSNNEQTCLPVAKAAMEFLLDRIEYIGYLN